MGPHSVKYFSQGLFWNDDNSFNFQITWLVINNYSNDITIKINSWLHFDGYSRRFKFEIQWWINIFKTKRDYTSGARLCFYINKSYFISNILQARA